MEQSNSSQDGGGPKKGPIDGLSKEELVKKCKGLLLIAQKAKLAKDEYAEDNKKLKEEVSKYENQKDADKKSLKAMQEVVESLTEAKLTLSTKVADLESENVKLESEIKSYVNIRNELSQISIENEAFKRQVDRLTKENEELLSDLDNMEKKLEQVNMFGIQQQKDLVILEKETLKWKSLEKDYEELKQHLELVTKQNDALKEENISLKNIDNDIEKHLEDARQLRITLESSEEIIANLRDDKLVMTNKINELTLELECTKSNCTPSCKSRLALEQLSSEFESLRSTEEKQAEKLQFFKTKLLECASKLKKLKNCRYALIETIKEYADSVPKWQNELLHASKQISKQFIRFENEKKDWLSKIRELEIQVDHYKSSTRDENVAISPAHIATLENLLGICDKVKNQFEDKCIIVDKLKQEIADLKAELSESLNAKDIKDNENKRLMEEITKLSQLRDEDQKKCNEIEKLYKDSVESLEELKCNNVESEKLSTELENLQAENISKIKELETLKKQLNIITEERDKIRIENKENVSEIQSLQDNLIDLNEKLKSIEEDNIKLSKNLKILNDGAANFTEETSVKVNKLQKENQEFLVALKENSNVVERLQSSLAMRENENSDLLAEMRELNEALKGRGDVISRQQDKIKELEAEIVRTSEKLSKIEVSLTEKDNIISQKEIKINNMNQQILTTKDELANLSIQAIDNKRIIKSLSDEVCLIRDKQQDTQSEVLSTSTISKVEESVRMKEVDESFDEKYNKLKSLAVKLKKKVQEQAAYIARIEHENQKNFDEKNEINLKLGSINVQVKNLQALQNENDKLLDEVEKLKKDNVNAEKLVRDLTSNMQNMEKQIFDLQSENNQIKSSSDNDKKSKTALDGAIKEYQNQIKSLKQEKESQNLLRKELEKEKDQLKKDLSVKDKELTALREQCDSIKVELEKSKTAGKQSSVLSLEIEAYEKSLNDVTQKLEGKTTLVKELQEIVETKENSIKSLNAQIKLLEESTQSEKTHSQELKQQIDIQQAKLKECEHDKSILRTQMQDITNECESLRSEVDELNLQLSRVASDKEKLCTSLQNEKEQLLRQVLQLEENLENVRAKLKNTELELEDLRADYASYKVRAQSVLRQNQSKESSRERELEDEMTVLQSTIETLNSKVKSLNEIIENNERKSEELQHDNERIQKRCKELMDLLEESRLQNEAILDDTRNQSAEYQESLKSQRLQIETLKNCYKKQIEDIEKKHSDEMEELKRKDNKENKLVSRIAPFGGPKITDEQKIDLILMEREDGEGSENSSIIPKRRISSTRSRRDIIPLDELLNTSLDENQNDDERSISPSLELQSTREKLYVQESQVKHLTSLLAEAEQDLAKLTELNELLKEEVRRHERTVEREQHMHNSEYLKNVVIKFLTLSSGDERSRLVPVLNTILKLSPEETNTLQNVAKGSEHVNRGWGSYLPIWSNHQ